MKKLGLVMLLAFSGGAFLAGTAPSACSQVNQNINRVYVTGRKKHEVAWARKHLHRFTHLMPVSDLRDADAILDLEPVSAPPPQDTGMPTSFFCTDSHNGSQVQCSDDLGNIERTACSTSRDGNVSCSSVYIDAGQLLNFAESLDALASTHAYLLSTDGQRLLWDYNDFDKVRTWSSALKKFVKHQMARPAVRAQAK